MLHCFTDSVRQGCNVTFLTSKTQWGCSSPLAKVGFPLICKSVTGNSLSASEVEKWGKWGKKNRWRRGGVAALRGVALCYTIYIFHTIIKINPTDPTELSLDPLFMRAGVEVEIVFFSPLVPTCPVDPH